MGYKLLLNFLQTQGQYLSAEASPITPSVSARMMVRSSSGDSKLEAQQQQQQQQIQQLQQQIQLLQLQHHNL